VFDQRGHQQGEELAAEQGLDAGGVFSSTGGVLTAAQGEVDGVVAG